MNQLCHALSAVLRSLPFALSADSTAYLVALSAVSAAYLVALSAVSTAYLVALSTVSAAYLVELDEDARLLHVVAEPLLEGAGVPLSHIDVADLARRRRCVVRALEDVLTSARGLTRCSVHCRQHTSILVR